VRTRSERGSRPCRMLNPLLHATAFRPLHFVAQGGTCQHCRSGLTPNDDLSFPCSGIPLREPPRQDQHSWSTASAFHRILRLPVRPLSSPAHPTSTLGWSGSSPAARCRLTDPLPANSLRTSTPLRGITPSGSLCSARFLSAKPTSSKSPIVLRSPPASLFYNNRERLIVPDSLPLARPAVPSRGR
jgi:hypothetical protein